MRPAIGGRQGPREARRANAGTSRLGRGFYWGLLGTQFPGVEGGDLVRVSGREAGLGEDGG